MLHTKSAGGPHENDVGSHAWLTGDGVAEQTQRLGHAGFLLPRVQPPHTSCIRAATIAAVSIAISGRAAISASGGASEQRRGEQLDEGLLHPVAGVRSCVHLATGVAALVLRALMKRSGPQENDRTAHGY